jgi:hypothetical protein
VAGRVLVSETTQKGGATPHVGGQSVPAMSLSAIPASLVAFCSTRDTKRMCELRIMEYGFNNLALNRRKMVSVYSKTEILVGTFRGVRSGILHCGHKPKNLTLEWLKII